LLTLNENGNKNLQSVINLEFQIRKNSINKRAEGKNEIITGFEDDSEDAEATPPILQVALSTLKSSGTSFVWVSVGDDASAILQSSKLPLPAASERPGSCRRRHTCSPSLPMEKERK
jgi:hypothetical protein